MTHDQTIVVETQSTTRPEGKRVPCTPGRSSQGLALSSRAAHTARAAREAWSGSSTSAASPFGRPGPLAPGQWRDRPFRAGAMTPGKVVRVTPIFGRPVLATSLLVLLLAACQGGSTAGPAASPTPSPAAAAATPIDSVAERPLSLARPTDIPTDGSCVSGHPCLGLLDPGPHHSKDFASGFAFTIARTGWQNREEVPWVLPLLPIDHPGDALTFFRNPRVAADDGTILPSVASDVPAMVAWFAANPSLEVTTPVDVTVGGLAGTRFDVSVATGAANTDPSCPVRVCQTMLAGEAAPGQLWGWGLAGIEKERIYLLTDATGTIAVVVDSVDGASFDDLTSRASEILATVKFD